VWSRCSCGGSRAWGLRSRALDQCASCDHQISLTAGTVFHGTRKPLRLWFRVIGPFLLRKSGCSATDISRQHGLKYETAWTWLHKLRSCMGQFGRAPLDGSVEVDETYLGGEDDEAHKGRSLTGHKTPIAAAVEWRGEAMGRIRIAAVLNATALSLWARNPGSRTFVSGDGEAVEREGVVSGGALNSPHLLMLSGILVVTTVFPSIDVGRLVVALSVVLLLGLAVMGGLLLRSRRTRETDKPPRLDRATWRMPPLALLERPPWSRGRLVGMWALRGYLVVAVLLMEVRAVQIASGHT